jgi:hypothetical protein
MKKGCLAVLKFAFIVGLTCLFLIVIWPLFNHGTDVVVYEAAIDDSGKVYSVTGTTYRAWVLNQQVVSLSESGEFVEKLGDCAVFDRLHWSCTDSEGNQTTMRSGELRVFMKEPLSPTSTLTKYFQVSRAAWWREQLSLPVQVSPYNAIYFRNPNP